MDDSGFKPAYTNTGKILNLVALIAARADVLTIQSGMNQNPKLLRRNRIRTVHSSLAIENNTLSLDQVTAILDGKRVLGPPQDICEAENAFKAYDRLLEYSPYDVNDLLAAHKVLMDRLVETPGQFRSGSIGVARGDELVHIAPLAGLVPGMAAELLHWAETTDVHPLVKSSVFHYEFEVIHPFPDGNGRMGRMWQALILYKWKEIFAWMPVETIILEHRDEYYQALGASNDTGDCTVFIEFILQAIWDTLENYTQSDQDTDQVTDQVKRLLDVLGDKALSAAELMTLLGLKHRPTFRKNYLHPALERNYIEMTLPDTPNAKGQKYRLKGDRTRF